MPVKVYDTFIVSDSDLKAYRLRNLRVESSDDEGYPSPRLATVAMSRVMNGEERESDT